MRARLLLAAGVAAAAAATPAAAAATPAAPAATPRYARYVVVGAGPAGLQAAHYLDSAGRDYVVLDRAPAPASFFARFPRWRQLISINKPNTGAAQLDAVYRQDWNSLLGEHSSSNRDHARSWAYAPVPCLLPPGAGGGGALVAAPNASSSGGGGSGSSLLCEAADYSSTDARYTDAGVARGAGLRLSELTDDYYPHADVLHGYLSRWAGGGVPRGGMSADDVPVHRALNIAFNTTVARVSRPPGFAAALAAADGSQAALIAAGAPRFRLEVVEGAAAADGTESPSPSSSVLECTFLLWAAGLQTPNTPDGVNIAAVAETYAGHSTDLARFVNKSVLLLGRGNGAFEVANHVLGVAARVHVIGRSTGRIRLATETHYPGDGERARWRRGWARGGVGLRSAAHLKT
jgi:hypothetical protein